MKNFNPAIVLLDDVVCSVPAENFSNTEQLARNILEIGGTINPPLLKKLGIDSYEVISGAEVYWAAKRAEEIDPMNGESINCYVVETAEEIAAYSKQITTAQPTVSKSPTQKKEMSRAEKAALIAQLAAELAA